MMQITVSGLEWRHNERDSLQITSLTMVYSTVYSGADQRKYHSSTSLAFLRGIHRSTLNSPHKEPITRKCFNLMTSSWISSLASGKFEGHLWLTLGNCGDIFSDSYLRCTSLGFTDDAKHFTKWCLGAIKQQAIAWTIINPDLCHHGASVGHTELSCTI